MSDMPMEIWALDAHLRLDDIHIGQFISKVNETMQGKVIKYHHDDKYRALEAENKSQLMLIETTQRLNGKPRKE
jgi:hypothetical protein